MSGTAVVLRWLRAQQPLPTEIATARGGSALNDAVSIRAGKKGVCTP